MVVGEVLGGSLSWGTPEGTGAAWTYPLRGSWVPRGEATAGSRERHRQEEQGQLGLSLLPVPRVCAAGGQRQSSAAASLALLSNTAGKGLTPGEASRGRMSAATGIPETAYRPAGTGTARQVSAFSAEIWERVHTPRLRLSARLKMLRGKECRHGSVSLASKKAAGGAAFPLPALPLPPETPPDTTPGPTVASSILLCLHVGCLREP